jgi:hypothetical protein
MMVNSKKNASLIGLSVIHFHKEEHISFMVITHTCF